LRQVIPADEDMQVIRPILIDEPYASTRALASI
jgi:hypothetical protein